MLIMTVFMTAILTLTVCKHNGNNVHNVPSAVKYGRKTLLNIA